jgi:cardiolipin synthase
MAPWALGLLLLMQGCATLPKVEGNKVDGSQIATPDIQFENSHGPVTEARSEAILGRLEGSKVEIDVLQKHLAYEQAINTSSPLMLGNKLTLLQNGPSTYKAMFAAIREARNHINLETYIFGGTAGEEFADLLLERQAAGVQVNLIYDSVGGIATPQATFDRLRAGGIQVLEFNPVNPLAGNKKGWLLNNRDHRRQLVIDGRMAFTGGVNISDTYSSTPKRQRKHPKQESKETIDTTTGWRDTHLQVEGPVVAEFQKLFIATWARQKGEPLAEKNYFPELQSQGDEIVRVIGHTPEAAQNLIYLTLLSAIKNAEVHVHLTVAYFAPDPQLLEALTAAAQRSAV